MDYPLLIEVELGLSKNQYSNLLHTNEIPRGLTIPINFYVTNLGVSSFDGTVKQIGFSFNKPNSEIVDITKDKPAYPIANLLEKSFKERKLFYRNTINIFEEGIVECICILKPYNEGDKIEYLTNNGNQSLGTKSWSHIFHVINREQLEIIKLLREIRDKIH